ncbi:alkane 1-monooxygenase [Flavobacterium sp. GCM10027622]|uniref:alkane 1-monooxygenase n=1 Tax=unclassified Flavobacterium TaxID=196869 RepID=UPI00360A2674
MKYLLAYTIPLAAFLGIYYQGIWAYSAWAYAFLLLPILEILMPLNEKNYSESEIQSKLSNRFYDILLYLNVPIVYGMLWFTLNKVTTTELTVIEFIGTILSLGIVLGSNGINVGHELGHREQRYERILGKLLLIPSHYTHFFIEHNHGHHLHVSTPEDPSTAKLNQNLYAFWIQTVTGTYTKAWKIQKKLNEVNQINFLNIKNDMFWFTLIQIGYLVTIISIFGTKGFLVALFSGIVGLLLLETINYIEHYGLMRKQTPSGRYERVTEKHSWNSNHILGRIILYELTRHSDHHYKSQKKYQILEYHDVSPQMPYGYPTSMVLSFFPPIWFNIMNKRIPKE